MARLRITLITTAAFVALAAFTLSSQAQQPQQGGRGGPGGGGRGPGGFGGFGGPGGFGGFNSLLGLASNPGIQGELKATEKQKVAIKSLNDKYNEKNREIRTQMGFGGGPGGPFGGPGGPGGGNQAGGNNGQGGAGGRGNRRGGGNAAADAANGGQGGGGQAGGGGGGGGGNGQGGGGGRGNRFNIDPEVQAKMAEMREMTTQLRLSAESSLGKILDKGQVARLKQIQLQLDPAGAFVVLREDMVEKLNMTEEQVQQLTELRNGQRQKTREIQKAGRQAFQATLEKINPDFAKNFGNRGNRGNRGNGGNAANGGNGGNGNAPADAGNAGNGGNGGNGNQGNRPPFDREAFQKMMENPDVVAERDKQRAAEKVVDDESYAVVLKALYPRQRTTLKKMVGAPFDRSVMGMGGPFGGGRPPGGDATAKNGDAKGKTTVAKANSDDDDEETAAPAPKPKAPTTAKTTGTTTRKKTLRELRSGSDDE